MKDNYIGLKNECKILVRHRQALSEIQGVAYSVFIILNKFNKEDWINLEAEVSSWSDVELEILAFVLREGNGIEELSDNYYYIHIFTIIGLPHALYLLEDMFEFIDGRKIDSLDLLFRMKARIEQLVKDKHLKKGRSYEFWMKWIEDLVAALGQK